MFRKNFAAVVVAIFALLLVGSAMAAGGKPGTVSKNPPGKAKTSPGKATASKGGAGAPDAATQNGPPKPKTPAKPVVHLPNGLRAQAWLDSRVSDGQTAGFAVKVTNNSGDTLHYGAVALYWSFDGAPAAQTIGWNSPNRLFFVDPGRNWVDIGELGPGQAFTGLSGTVNVPDRMKAKMADAQSLCIQPWVEIIYPQHPSADVWVAGNMTCQLYAGR